jgi:peptidoglycan/xylan/chitin deacetylase (PgdA/CDA1 family)
MPGFLFLIWDYDTAIGQINATYPYNFRQEPILEEIENVNIILKLGADYGISMTFACVGLAGESGNYPYHVPEQIRRIHESGHEIASHSWKHEWFPFLEKEQIRRSLARSKLTLENCIGVPGGVKGFVPPFSRPMSWYRKGAISLGDRALGPWYPGADIGSLLKSVNEAGYTWCRLSYRPLWRRLADRLQESNIRLKYWLKTHDIMIVPNNYCGFDEPALKLVEMAAEKELPLVISGHPAGLSRMREESLEKFKIFLQRVSELQSKGKIKYSTVSEYPQVISEEMHGG